MWGLLWVPPLHYRAADWLFRDLASHFDANVWNGFRVNGLFTLRARAVHWPLYAKQTDKLNATIIQHAMTPRGVISPTQKAIRKYYEDRRALETQG